MAAVRIFFVCIVKIRVFLAKKNIYKKLHLTAAAQSFSPLVGIKAQMHSK